MQKHFYTCLPLDPNSEEGKKFLNSAWAGEGYDSKKDANEHKRFFESKFGCKFEVIKENY